jgi:hypothetical protein
VPHQAGSWSITDEMTPSVTGPSYYRLSTPCCINVYFFLPATVLGLPLRVRALVFVR